MALLYSDSIQHERGVTGHRIQFSTSLSGSLSPSFPHTLFLSLYFPQCASPLSTQHISGMPSLLLSLSLPHDGDIGIMVHFRFFFHT